MRVGVMVAQPPGVTTLPVGQDVGVGVDMDVDGVSLGVADGVTVWVGVSVATEFVVGVGVASTP